MRKSIFIILLVAALAARAQAPIANGGSQIGLGVYVPEQTDSAFNSVIPTIESKLLQLTTANGVTGNAEGSRFIITANASVLSKDVTPTAPPMHAVTLQLTLYIGDGVDGTLYSTLPVTLKGVGTNETKAYLAAIKSLKGTDKVIQDFIGKGKNKIADYYNSNCDQIIKSAQLLAAQGKYDQALFTLASVPNASGKCYERVTAAILPLYQAKINADCKTLLLNATTTWNSNQTSEGAMQASGYLAQIEPNAACYKDAIALSGRIAEKLRQDEKREWDFKMKERDLEIDLQKQTLQAAREIAVAYAKTPQLYVYSIDSWW